MNSIFSLLTSEQWTALSAIATLAALAYPVISWLRNTWRIRSLNAQTGALLHRDVFGREAEVKLIAESFAGDARERARLLAIVGGAGAGKTTLARYYKTEARSKYDRTLTLPAENSGTLSAELAGFVLREMGEGAPASVRFRSEMALELIAKRAAQERWLVIFDNAPDQGALRRFLPDGKNLDILVTSRNPEWRGPGVQVMRPSQLGMEDALALLTEEAGRSSDNFEDLAEALDFLPLAMIQAGEWLRARPDARVGDYLASLDKWLHRRQGAASGGRDYTEATGAALRLSYNDLSKDARLVASALSGFDPDTIDKTAFRRLALNGWKWRWFMTLSGLIRPRMWRIARNAARLDAAFRELELKSLLEPSETEGLRRMHRVTGRVIRTIVGEKKVLRTVAGLMAASFPRNTIASSTWPDCNRLLPHVRAILQLDQFEDHSLRELWAHGLYLHAVGDYLLRIGDVETSVKATRVQYEMSHDSFLKGSKGAIMAEFRYGMALEKNGELEAAERHVRNAIEAMSAKSPDNASLGAFHTILARVIEAQSEKNDDAATDVALKEQQRSLALRLKSSGRIATDVAESLHNLAMARERRGQVNAALRLFHASDRVFAAAIDDPEDYRLAYPIGEIGRILLKHGYPFDAFGFLERTLYLRRLAYSETPDHMEVRSAAAFLLNCLLVLGRIEDGVFRHLTHAVLLMREFEGMGYNADHIDELEDAYWANVDADYRAGLRFGIERAPTLIWPRHLPEDTSGFAEVAFPGQSA